MIWRSGQCLLLSPSSANIGRCFIKTRSLVDIEAQQVCDLFSFILYLCRGFHPLKTLTKPSSLLESHPIRRVIHASPPVLFLEAAQVSPKLNPLASVSPLLGDCKHVSSCRTPIPMTFKILFKSRAWYMLSKCTTTTHIFFLMVPFYVLAEHLDMPLS